MTDDRDRRIAAFLALLAACHRVRSQVRRWQVAS